MASGMTTTGSLADSLPEWIMSARQIREFEGVVPQLVTRERLGEGLGITWQEVSFAQVNAQDITENTELDNPQQVSDTNLAITPTVIGVQVRVTDRVKKRIVKVAMAKLGGLAQNAVQRKKDEDGLTVLDSGATTCSPGAGATLTSGHIAAAVTNIQGNYAGTNPEPGNPPYRAVLHPVMMKDLYDELVAGVGAGVVSEGPTARVFQSGFNLPIAGCEVYSDGNMPVDSSDDAKGGVFPQEGIILVEGMAPRAVTVRREHIGGGAEDVYHYDEYAYGYRTAQWLFEIQADVSEPTS